MRWHDVAADWPGFQAAILTRWPEADEVEVAAIDGDHADFVDYVARLDGVDRAEAAEAVAAWLVGPMPADARMDEVLDDANIRGSAAHIPEGEDVYAEDARFGDEPDVSRR